MYNAWDRPKVKITSTNSVSLHLMSFCKWLRVKRAELFHSHIHIAHTRASSADGPLGEGRDCRYSVQSRAHEILHIVLHCIWYIFLISGGFSPFGDALENIINNYRYHIKTHTLLGTIPMNTYIIKKIALITRLKEQVIMKRLSLFDIDNSLKHWQALHYSFCLIKIHISRVWWFLKKHH